MDPHRFKLTDDHIKLLRRAYVSWQNGETGASAIDCKRPYGNSSVAQDVAEILGRASKACSHCGESDIDEDEMLRLHRETETALQIILQSGKFQPGVYERNGYASRWARRPDPPRFNHE